MERNDSETSWTFPNIRLRSIHGFIGITGGPHPTQIMQICMIHNALQLMQSYKSLATCKSLDRRPMQLQFCVWERSRGAQFWFNSALKRWLRGAVIDMWASSVRQQLWLVEPAVNHPPPIVPLPAASGLRRTSLSLVCTVTSHRVCASESEGCFHGYDLISFIIKITLLYS